MASPSSFLFTLSLLAVINFCPISAFPTDPNAITSIQNDLRTIGWPIAADGDYGPATTAAVKSFQAGWTFQFLTPDGDAGTLTRPEISKCAAGGGYASTHFKYAEFKSKGNGDIRVARDLLFGLEKLRAAMGGKSLTIISGYRDPAHNAAVGGASSSQHLLGTAADIPQSYGATPAFVQGLGVFTGIGIKCSQWVTHVDVRPGSPSSPVTWPYPC